MYDFEWRHYMPDIGRWNGMDQLVEKYMPISPYAYVANNPISLIDPDGRRIIRNIDRTYTFIGNDKIIHDYYMDNGGSASEFWFTFRTNVISSIKYGNGKISIIK